jgi:hypothetical protein
MSADIIDSALANIIDEMGEDFDITSAAGGTPVSVRALFFERPSQASLAQLRQPHDGPTAEFRVQALADAGLDGLSDGDLLAGRSGIVAGRSFAVKRVPRSRTGLAVLAELVESR